MFYRIGEDVDKEKKKIASSDNNLARFISYSMKTNRTRHYCHQVQLI